MPDLAEIQKQLDALRTKFANGLVQRIEQIITDFNTLASQPDPARCLHEVFRKIHSLSGSAGTFGFMRLSQQARQLELILTQFINNDSLPDARTTDNLNHGFEKLYLLVNDGPDEQHSSQPYPDTPADQIKTEKQVYVVTNNLAQGRELCHQLNAYEFSTRLFTMAEVFSALEHEKPEALILDFDLTEKLLTDSEFESHMRYLLQESIPFIFISSQQDWDSRLAAARTGSKACLCKPVDFSLLIDNLERITRPVPREPYRVLVVDDTVELTRHYSLILRQAGMYAEALTEPADILKKLENFHPELILLDYHFPEISGLDIARVLRQHPVHFSIPIVFLSTESDPDIQLTMLQQSDYLLEKPILDNHLVSTVKSRIEYARTLGQLMYHDKQTGLLSRITLQQRLVAELSRSQRQTLPLTFVMLEIDHFEQLNNRYGYSAGDQVLADLALLLKHRLRKSDLTGRYGSAKFAIIMPNTQTEKAFQIIEKLRIRFTLLPRRNDDQEFTCSFSAGIACSLAFDEDKLLIEAAIEALHIAQTKGRNLTTLHRKCL